MAGEAKEKHPGREPSDAGTTEEIDACGLCASLFSDRQARSSCGADRKPGRSPWRFMTEREFKVLEAMRGLREKAARVKNRIRALERGLQTRRPPEPPPHQEAGTADGSDDALWEQETADELLLHCERLARLKAEWREMDTERLAAQEERMRLLGHIQ